MRLLVLLTFAICNLSLPCVASPEGIGWIPTWKQAQAEAAKTHKPILLVAAAPQCAGVSGIW